MPAAPTTDLLILGTDTDAGKTALALLWLAAWADAYEYWKPLETGDPDSQRVGRSVPAVVLHAPLAQFQQPVAPLLAARGEGRTIPPANEIAAARPLPSVPGRRLLIETFGSPFSPLNETELQIALVQALAAPSLLVASSAVGAIGRVLQCLESLRSHGVRPAAVVLMGRPDEFAVEQLARHCPDVRAFCLEFPETWDAAGIARAARRQIGVLDAIRSCLTDGSAAPHVGKTVGARTWLPPHSPQGGEIAELIERDRRCVWHPYTSLQDPDLPLVAVAAEDEFLFLADGRRVIDGISSWWTILHGHRHPLLLRALDEAARSLDHVHFAGVTHPSAVALAELLLGSAPWSGGRAFFSDNGSTAVEVALKMAYQYWCHQDQPHRTWFVGFQGGYHGDTFGTMSVSRDPTFFGRFEPLLFSAEIVPLSAAGLDEVLTRRAGQVAAAIVEPLVQGAGGMRMYPAQQLAQLADVARRHGVLLIVDEVMTGGGRTGHLWRTGRPALPPT